MRGRLEPKDTVERFWGLKFMAQGGCWWDYIQCLKMRKRKRKKRKKRKKKIRKKGGRRELNLK